MNFFGYTRFFFALLILVFANQSVAMAMPCCPMDGAHSHPAHADEHHSMKTMDHSQSDHSPSLQPSAHKTQCHCLASGCALVIAINNFIVVAMPAKMSLAQKPTDNPPNPLAYSLYRPPILR